MLQAVTAYFAPSDPFRNSPEGSGSHYGRSHSHFWSNLIGPIRAFFPPFDRI